MFLKLVLNAMIRNIKIPNNLDVIEISKSMEPNKCTHWKKYDFFKKNVSFDLKISMD
jgi:hypothetical protein